MLEMWFSDRSAIYYILEISAESSDRVEMSEFPNSKSESRVYRGTALYNVLPDVSLTTEVRFDEKLEIVVDGDT